MTIPRNVESLRASLDSGRELDYLFFPDAGTLSDPLTSSCLSQWALTPFQLGNAPFHSAEQAMMHGKALLFEDFEMAERILQAKTPFQAKSLGAKVRGFSETVWVQRRFEVVVAANLGKFGAIAALGDYLLGTGESVLVEESSFDRVWGCGLDESDRDARNPRRWPGLNLLGFALMAVRERLREVSVPGTRADSLADPDQGRDH